ncbi:hypothetical protein H2200_011476 [Cladophialophora chaetospira]|uniref:Uncharacterized protein n=1 Tax=Cladophialophora chaetospira TaxID=386627 RepID=A0AA38WZF1_9EURO|nr:hypothetical protein H2200_011476 [Cladophialophora chaetospira]
MEGVNQDEVSQSTIPRKPVPRTNRTNDLSTARYSNLKEGSSHHARTPNTFNIWQYTWIVEVVSLFVAILAFAATVTTVAIYQNHPLPRWPSHISTNALVAIFTTILKAALMMPVAEGYQLKWNWFHKPRTLIDMEKLDSASRGPWGSFRLVFTVYRHYLALLGALISLAALAIDPFSQQVLHYYSCLQPVSDIVGTISATNNYTKFGVHTSARDTTLDNAMASALYTGTINPAPNASFGMPFQCATGNCTFSEDQGATHMSLAMCGSCADISDRIVQNTSTTKDPSTGDFDPTRGLDRYFLDPEADTDYNISIGNDFEAFWLATRPYWPFYGSRYISAFDALMFRQSSCSNASSASCTYEPVAFNCEIYPCLKTYWGKIANSVLDEKELSSVRIPNATTDGYNSYTIASKKTIRNGVLQDCVGASEPSPTNPAAIAISTTAVDQNGATTFNIQYEYYPNDCVWNFGSQTTDGLRTFLATNLFSAGGLSNSEDDTPAGAVGLPWLVNMFMNGSATLDTMNHYLKGLSNSMTVTMRQNGDPPNLASPTGVVYITETCIHVQWAWLSLPAALLFLAAIFLGITIFTSRAAQPKWKSSALALLFHGLDDKTREKHSDLSDLRDIRKTSGDVQGQLVYQSSGWHVAVK